MTRLEAKRLSILDQAGLLDEKDVPFDQLSGGQQQRAAISRALVMDPGILSLDGPTSALDPELTGEVLKVIRGLKSSDRTMVIVTHEMEFARNVSDKVLFMADGLGCEYGTPEEIFGNSKTERLRIFLHAL